MRRITFTAASFVVTAAALVAIWKPVSTPDGRSLTTAEAHETLGGNPYPNSHVDDDPNCLTLLAPCSTILIPANCPGAYEYQQPAGTTWTHCTGGGTTSCFEDAQMVCIIECPCTWDAVMFSCYFAAGSCTIVEQGYIYVYEY